MDSLNGLGRGEVSIDPHGQLGAVVDPIRGKQGDEKGVNQAGEMRLDARGMMTGGREVGR